MVSVAEALAIGTQHLQAGKLAEAERIYRQVLQVDPQNAQALCLLGTLALRAGQLEAAVHLLHGAIRQNPAEAGYFVNLAEALRRQGKLAESIACSRKAIELNPRVAVAYANLGLTYLEHGEAPASAAAYRQAILLEGANAEHHIGLGRALFEAGELSDAELSLRRAVELAPNNGSAQFNLGRVLYPQMKLDEAIDCFRRAAALNSNLSESYSNLGTLLNEQGQLDEALHWHRMAVQHAPDNARAHSSLVYAMNYHPVYDADSLWREHRAWGQRHADRLSAASSAHDNERQPERCLRIGYVSPHFWSHAVNFFTEPILANHDHSRFEVFCYCDVAAAQRDAATERLRGYADAWRDIVGLSNQQVSQTVRGDRIDILVDLTGHIWGTRLLAFSQRPAPVQVTYIGYQNTTGMQAMDYRLTDDWADPPGTTDRYYTERLVRLPKTFFCYQPTSDAPPVGPLPALANGFVTFGSFNNFVKITPQVLAAWASLLRQVPDARLRILAKVGDRLRDYVQTVFEQHRVDPSRVELWHWRPRSQYLEMIASTDVALDAFPFNGHTTTCDALWQGVPVVTLAGDSYVSRFGSSAHQNLGLQDLVASSVEQYIEIAAKLAHDTPRLAELRASLRERMSASPILDHRQFTRNLEAAYRQMWLDWCQRPVGT